VVHISCWLQNRPVGIEGYQAALRKLAKTVRERRMSLRLTQEDVAWEADLSIRQYQSLEAGRGNPTYKTLYSVAAVLKTTVADLLEKTAIRRKSS
jgi:transcriptional regulator with XRE-family HTH domain